MGKFVLIVVCTYIIYYAGNIIYDLFVKPKGKGNKEPKENHQEVFSIQSDDEEVKNITIDDEEDILIPDAVNFGEEGFEIEREKDLTISELRERFENENSLNNESEYKEDKEEEKKLVAYDFNEIMKMAETKVYMVENLNGHKVYASRM
ncbi:hypothetical protein [Riemerella columbipharyngis]|uniref:Uncharacterized protein n=1 Tax=Riemerella columbipharyngis TaxID=1071918 RepID=A0A1G6ZAM5_9FLAO|nr:hypothetical protein [Riemerella columbipharyngis]SDD99650.1 hypothetical protein SAMN05421544_10221 [Riemerella columbipharyngis]